MSQQLLYKVFSVEDTCSDNRIHCDPSTIVDSKVTLTDKINHKSALQYPTHVDAYLTYEMGCRFKHGSAILQHIFDVVPFIMTQENHQIGNYIYDFLCVPLPSKIKDSYSRLQSLLRQLGLNISGNKLVPPSIQVFCLGFLVNTFVNFSPSILTENCRLLSKCIYIGLLKVSILKRATISAGLPALHYQMYQICLGFLKQSTYLEMTNILVASKVLHAQWAGHRVLINSDNKAVVSALNNGRSSDKFLSKIARNVFMWLSGK